MSNTNAVYARIDTNLKENAESILNQLGITPSSAIQMLYSQIVLQKGMPLLNVKCASGIFWPFLESSVVLLITAFFE